SVRDTFTAESVRRFYARWYRPENLTLVLVGDLGDLDPVAAIEKSFGDFRAPAGPPDPEPAIGTPTFAHPVYTVEEEDASTVTISIARARPWTERPDDVAHARADLPLSFARSMLDLRFHELAKKEGTPFLGAQAASLRANGLRAEDGEGLEITCTKE